jgi:hypothetical protein
MFSQERKNTSRAWMSSLAAVLVVLALGGIGLYWHNAAIAKRLHDEAAQKVKSCSRARRRAYPSSWA